MRNLHSFECRGLGFGFGKCKVSGLGVKGLRAWGSRAQGFGV